MNWQFWNRKPKDVIPNPRSRQRRDEFEEAQRSVLLTLQFLVFSLALMLLAAVSYAFV